MRPFELTAGVLAAALLWPLAARGVGVEPASPPVVDLHVDLSYRVNYAGGSFDQGSGQVVAAHLLAGGVQGLVLPLFVPHRVSRTGPRAEDLEGSYWRVSSLIPSTPPYRAPGCADPAGGVRTWLAFEGSAPLVGDDAAIARWTARGVRLFGLVHTTDNALATSSTNRDPLAGGLTAAGRDFVRRVHREGGVVDVSHASRAATRDVVQLALTDHVPVVATHSNAAALAPHPRNLTDAELRAIASTGGVVGVNFHSPFLVRRGRATVDDVVRHIRHMLDIAGPDHVAIGSDFEGDITPPSGLEAASAFPVLARALRAAGVPPDGIEKVFARNALRILCPAPAPR